MTDRSSGMCETYAILRDWLFREPLLKPVISQVGQIRQLVERGVPADFSFDGWTFLHTVCLLGNVELLEFLLHSFKEKDGELCKRLLNQRFFGVTALHCAVQSDTQAEEICRVLFDQGADVNASGRFGDTPLHRACEYKTEFTTGMCKLLLDHGADVKARDRYGDTPLHKACEHPTELAKEVCRLLLDHGADINSGHENGRTPLLRACDPAEFAIGICKLLLDHGAHVNALSGYMYSCTPLLIACEYQTEFTKGMCRLLLDHGANGNDRDGFGNAPLHWACKNQSQFAIEMCKLLLDHGADVNAGNGDGDSPLHRACSYLTHFSKKYANCC